MTQDGQIYLFVNVNLAATIKRGGLRAGAMAIPLTDEILRNVGDDLREELARRCSTDPNDRYVYHLRTAGTTGPDIARALANAVQERAKEEADKKQLEADKAARKAREIEELIEKYKAAPLDDLVRLYSGRWIVNEDCRYGAEPLKAAGRLQEAKDEANRRNAAHQAEQAEKAAREQAAEERELFERKAWIEAHGSPRLQRLLKEDIEHGAVYRDERLAKDRPGWRWGQEVPGTGDEPRNPPQEAIDMLDEALETLPDGEREDVSLVYWTIGGPSHTSYYDEDEDDDVDDGWRGYAVEAVFLGRKIVYGGPDA